MKNFYVLLMVIVFIIISHAANAQQAAAKPAQFAAYPESISLSETQLSSLFTQPVNAAITLNLAGGFTFKGVVQSVDQPFAYQQSLIIRSTNFPGSVFSLSKITEATTGARYVGRILSFQHSDLFELQYENGACMLRKRQFDHVIQTCPQH